jgi:formate dehydrogenase iron-sulfur subunit
MTVKAAGGGEALACQSPETKEADARELAATGIARARTTPTFRFMTAITGLPLLKESPPSERAPTWLIEQLLAEQQTLPAVERFAAWHDEHARTCAAPPPHVAYRSLIPLSAPGPGEQYAFEVDLDACSGCKACVTACHSLNGLDEHETWRDVGLLISTDERPSLQYVTSACHHCVEPACLAGCPVKAYDKDAVTGIVRHLDDQCIGCQYCVLMCPYDVPKYSPAKGIVRKCDMCRQRLAASEAPACVAACPNQAIRITTMKKVDAVAAARAGDFLEAAPNPQQTIPTTRYLSHQSHATWRAADSAHIQPAHAHWPLVAMLVLTQASVGVLLAERILSAAGLFPASLPLLSVSLVIGGLGGQAAMFHLGRPLGAWRAWLGLRTSWLSREIVAFGLYFALLAFAGGCSWQGDVQLGDIAAWSALSAGMGGVFSSVMIYVVTQRPAWNLLRTGGKFLLTSLLFAAMAGGAVVPQVWVVAMIVAAAKLLFEAACNWHSLDKSGRVSASYSPLGQSARLLRGPLERWHSLRIVLACAALLGMGFAAASGSVMAAAIVVALASAGELLERTLFFRAIVPPKMPGGMA